MSSHVQPHLIKDHRCTPVCVSHDVQHLDTCSQSSIPPLTSWCLRIELMRAVVSLFLENILTVYLSPPPSLSPTHPTTCSHPPTHTYKHNTNTHTPALCRSAPRWTETIFGNKNLARVPADTVIDILYSYVPYHRLSDSGKKIVNIQYSAWV